MTNTNQESHEATALAVVQQQTLRQVYIVEDAVPILDTARFEHMQRVARIMAETSMIPDSLRTIKEGTETVDLPPQKILANCFMVVNQAVRWGMDPFAVAQCCSVVHGRLMYEGKLVAAVIDAKLGVRLAYTFTNEDRPFSEKALGVVVSGTIPGEPAPRTVEGTVAMWHKGDKSPWGQPAAWKRQLRYMGAREWARAHAPAIMLGVITDDEADESMPPQRMRGSSSRGTVTRLTASTANGSAPAIMTAAVPTADGPAKVAAQPDTKPDTTAGQASATQEKPADTEPAKEPAKEAAVEFDLGEPDDRDTITADLIAAITGAPTAADAERIYLDAEDDLASLGDDRRARVEAAYQTAASKAKPKKKAGAA